MNFLKQSKVFNCFGNGLFTSINYLSPWLLSVFSERLKISNQLSRQRKVSGVEALHQVHASTGVLSRRVDFCSQPIQRLHLFVSLKIAALR
jgi:hypothetical protein